MNDVEVVRPNESVEFPYLTVGVRSIYIAADLFHAAYPRSTTIGMVNDSVNFFSGILRTTG